MTLARRINLGPYDILSPIGAGGMGEVWKARDTRLGRIVAIKKVKEQHSKRFKQEARSIATLNHPDGRIVKGYNRREKRWQEARHRDNVQCNRQRLDGVALACPAQRGEKLTIGVGIGIGIEFVNPCPIFSILYRPRRRWPRQYLKPFTN